MIKIGVSALIVMEFIERRDDWQIVLRWKKKFEKKEMALLWLFNWNIAVFLFLNRTRVCEVQILIKKKHAAVAIVWTLNHLQRDIRKCLSSFFTFFEKWAKKCVFFSYFRSLHICHCGNKTQQLFAGSWFNVLFFRLFFGISVCIRFVRQALETTIG